MRNLLILGGTTEASALAAGLAADPRFDTVLSFAGATRSPRVPSVAHRVGGFGGATGLASFLQRHRTDLLVDATHPFAAQMKRHAVSAAAMAGVPMLAIRRPPWTPLQGDRWHEVADMQAAALAIGAEPQRVLLTIGQKDLAAFCVAPAHHYVVRSVDPPDRSSLPPDNEIISARGPFHQADEENLLRDRRISLLITKNSGGAATEAKLVAARVCAIPVIMVARPALPEAPAIAVDVEAAWRWLDRHGNAERRV